MDDHLRFWALNSPKRDLYNLTCQRAHRKLQKQGGHFQISVDFQVKNSGSGVLRDYHGNSQLQNSTVKIRIYQDGAKSQQQRFSQ